MQKSLGMKKLTKLQKGELPQNPLFPPFTPLPRLSVKQRLL
jgi:hypothetical protein